MIGEELDLLTWFDKKPETPRDGDAYMDIIGVAYTFVDGKWKKHEAVSSSDPLATAN